MTNLFQIAVDNKDIFTTFITLGIFIGVVIPLLRGSIKDLKDGINGMTEAIKLVNKSMESTNKIMQEHMLDDARQLTNIFNKLEDHRQEAHSAFDRIAQNSLKTILDTEQSIDLLKTQMWYVSQKKIDFIKGIILNNHIIGNNKKIREKLFNGLLALSDEYMSKFSTYKTPIGDLGKWLDENFTEKDFQKLVDDVLEIIYKEYEGKESDNTLNKVNEILMIMKTIQVGLANQLRKDLSKI